MEANGALTDKVLIFTTLVVNHHSIPLVSAIIGSVFGMQNSINFVEIKQPIGAQYEDQRTKLKHAR